MVTQRSSQAPTQPGSHNGSRRTAIARVMFYLALCLLIGAIAPVTVAAPGTDSAPPQRLYIRQADGIWISDDAGTSWTQAGVVPSRPLALAVAPATPGLVFVGTESLGLFRSNDGGASWQPVESAVLGLDQGAPVAVTALAIDPEDEQIVYAATNIWLGTNTAHLTPLGVAVSVDGGRQWIELSRAQLGDTPLQRLEPVLGHPLSVVTVNSTGSHTVRLALSPALLGLLQDANPAVRASAARAIGLIGDSTALPGLLQDLADPDALAGQRIAEAIGRIGDGSVSAALLNLLGSPPTAAQANAALALGLLKAPAAVPGLAALLSAGDAAAQRVAAEALAAIGTPAALTALIAPLADPEMTSARQAAMGGLEMAGQLAVEPLVVALLDGSAVVRANAAEMLGWLTPIEDAGRSSDAVAGLERLLSDSASTVRAQAAWALGEMDIEQARLALKPAPIVARPVAAALPAALPGAIADVRNDYVTVGATAALLTLVMVAGLAVALIWRGKRSTSHLGHT